MKMSNQIITNEPKDVCPFCGVNLLMTDNGIGGVQPVKVPIECMGKSCKFWSVKDKECLILLRLNSVKKLDS